MKVALLVVTLLMSVGLSVFMWAIGVIPFDPFTSALHVSSIYIGIAGVLIYQRTRE